MDIAILIEIFGYIGSAFVVISMLMTSVVKLRVINTVGCVISLIYAAICGVFPLALMNGCLIVINGYNLFKLLKTRQEYDLVESSVEDASVKYFLERYGKDIQQYFPGFDGKTVAEERAFMVYANGTPSGLTLGKEENGTMDIVIDYSAPAYRDCSIGSYLYAKLPAKGIHTLTFSQMESKTHTTYLSDMGYVKENNTYIKNLV